MPIRLPPWPACGAALLAVTLGCDPSSTNPRINYVTFFLDNDGYFHVPWRAEEPFPVDPPCFGFETDLVGRAVLFAPSTIDGIDGSDQGSDTYFRYRGNEDGAAADGCSGEFEAQFTYDGRRFFLLGDMTRPFPDMSEVDDSDPDPHATGGYAEEGAGGTSGDFTFWAYEHDP